MKLIHDSFRRSRHWTGVAPAQPGTVIADDLIGLGQLSLQIIPAKYGRHQPRLQKDGRTAAACFKNVQSMSPQIHQSPRRRMHLAIPTCPQSVVHHANQDPTHRESQNPCECMNQLSGSTRESVPSSTFCPWKWLCKSSAT